MTNIDKILERRTPLAKMPTTLYPNKDRETKVKSRDVTVHVDIFKEEDTYVVYCPTLDLSSCGKTREEALKKFEKAAGLFFEELGEMGTTDKVLQELGWHKSDDRWVPPKVTEQDLRIPIPG